MHLSPDDMLKIVLAIIAGGVIGIEREFRDKAAGFRTHIFICVGATLFTIFSTKLAYFSDPTRISANIVTGIGFLGAGVILREGGRVIGLTTAATIWLTAALGMGIGGGQYALAGIAVVLSLAVLWFFPRLEHHVDNLREERTYEIVCCLRPEKLTEIEETFRKGGLRIRSHRQMKSADNMIITWHVGGLMADHHRVVQLLFADDEVKELRF